MKEYIEIKNMFGSKPSKNILPHYDFTKSKNVCQKGDSNSRPQKWTAT